MGSSIFLIGLLIVLIGIAFWVYMLFHVIRYESDIDKIVWVAVLIFTNIFGAIIYMFYRLFFPRERP